MVKHLLFIYSNFYPSGGWNDFKGAFENIDDAVIVASNSDEYYGWWHVIDTDTRECVASGKYDEGFHRDETPKIDGF